MQSFASMFPIIAFFLVYKFSYIVVPNIQPIIAATFCLVVISTLSVLYHIILKKRQEKMAFYSNIAIIIFGGATVFFHNPAFIKVKITIINALFGCFMFYNAIHKNPPIQNFFKGKLQMSVKSWQSFSIRLAIMFFAIAIANEVVHRNFTEDFWVKFKVFYVPIFSFIYFALQIRFLMKHSQK